LVDGVRHRDAENAAGETNCARWPKANGTPPFSLLILAAFSNGKMKCPSTGESELRGIVNQVSLAAGPAHALKGRPRFGSGRCGRIAPKHALIWGA